jgi:hypothetical protein
MPRRQIRCIARCARVDAKANLDVNKFTNPSINARAQSVQVKNLREVLCISASLSEN